MNGAAYFFKWQVLAAEKSGLIPPCAVVLTAPNHNVRFKVRFTSLSILSVNSFHRLLLPKTGGWRFRW